MSIDIEKHFADFRKDLARLILQYKLDVSVGISAPDLAESLVDCMAMMQRLAEKFR